MSLGLLLLQLQDDILDHAPSFTKARKQTEIYVDCLIRLFRQTKTREDSEQQFLQELRQCNVSKSSQVPLGRRAGMI